MIYKTNSSDIYNGCFSELKPVISYFIKPGISLQGNPYDLIGSQSDHNTFPSDDSASQWINISFHRKFINPTGYML